MCSPTKDPYNHPSLGTTFAGVTVVAGWESPSEALRSAKLLANHLEMIFFPSDFQGCRQVLFGQWSTQPMPMSLPAGVTGLGQQPKLSHGPAQLREPEPS